MAKYARLDANGCVIEVFEHDTIKPEDVYVPHLVAEFIVVPDNVCPGMQLLNGVWMTPPAIDSTPVFPTLEPLDFYLAFTPAERAAIKKSIDPLVQEFWDTYERCERAGKPIIMNRPTVQQDLQYLRAQGILASDERIIQISNGIPQ